MYLYLYRNKRFMSTNFLKVLFKKKNLYYFYVIFLIDNLIYSKLTVNWKIERNATFVFTS